VIDGQVTVWGFDEESHDSHHRAIVPNLFDVKQIAIGYWHNAALLENGTVKAWGFNEYGGLGIGSTGYGYVGPIVIPGLSNVRQIVAGYDHTLALLEDGTVMAWGINTSGQLGLGDLDVRITPTM